MMVSTSYPPLKFPPSHHPYSSPKPNNLRSKSHLFKQFISIPSAQCRRRHYCSCTQESAQYDAVSDTYGDDQVEGGGVAIKILKIGKRCRRIESRVLIDAGFQIVWGILTDYERLADFIPGLVVSQLIDKGDNYARLFQATWHHLVRLMQEDLTVYNCGTDSFK